MKGEVHKVQAMRHQIGNQRQDGECVFMSQSGGFAGGGAEKTPAGDYSINTPVIDSDVNSSITEAAVILGGQFESRPNLSNALVSFNRDVSMNVGISFAHSGACAPILSSSQVPSATNALAAMTPSPPDRHGFPSSLMCHGR
jgi:hypothetical protein